MKPCVYCGQENSCAVCDCGDSYDDDYYEDDYDDYEDDYYEDDDD